MTEKMCNLMICWYIIKIWKCVCLMITENVSWNLSKKKNKNRKNRHLHFINKEIQSQSGWEPCQYFSTASFFAGYIVPVHFILFLFVKHIFHRALHLIAT